jgi:hypothetical protein
MISIKKSKLSLFPMLLAISFFYKVPLRFDKKVKVCKKLLRFASCVWSHARWVSSMMKISQALAKRTGASALIIYRKWKWKMEIDTLTSSSDLMIFLTLAKGNKFYLKYLIARHNKNVSDFTKITSWSHYNFLFNLLLFLLEFL